MRFILIAVRPCRFSLRCSSPNCSEHFVIDSHPCPVDYWRFAEHGIQQLARRAGFSNIETGRSVGPATGAYRILVEFFAILLSPLIPRANSFAKKLTLVERKKNKLTSDRIALLYV